MRPEDAFRRVETYDLVEYPFPSAIAQILSLKRLDLLHQKYPRPQTCTGDQDTPIHKAFYHDFSRLRQLYERFLREWVAPAYAEDLCVQRVPTFRVHYPKAKAIREFHRDSDYNHQVGTVNYWLPLTRAFSTNSVWLEIEPGAEEFRPIEMIPGQVLCFDALRLKHGNHRNDTYMSRVSFDFRVIPLQHHRYINRKSVTKGIPLELGAYYMLLTKEGEFRNDYRA